jgi:hypothetical protein
MEGEGVVRRRRFSSSKGPAGRRRPVVASFACYSLERLGESLSGERAIRLPSFFPSTALMLLRRGYPSAIDLGNGGWGRTSTGGPTGSIFRRLGKTFPSSMADARWLARGRVFSGVPCGSGWGALLKNGGYKVSLSLMRSTTFVSLRPCCDPFDLEIRVRCLPGTYHSPCTLVSVPCPHRIVEKNTLRL